MPAKTRPEHNGVRGASLVPMLTDWAKQGIGSLFATQRILSDLVMRQNANTIYAVKEQLATARSASTEALTEMAGEGISNFIAAQRVLMHLVQRENEILMTGVQERTGNLPPVAAVTDLLRRVVDTFIEMHQHFLTIAAKETDSWIEATQSGEPFDGKGAAQLAREAVDNFVRSQKKFLDVIAEETAVATGAANGTDRKATKTELAELARQGAEAFIDAQKKLLDVAAQQMAVEFKAARRTVQALNPFQGEFTTEFPRQTVENFVTAQKALLDLMAKPMQHEDMEEKPARKAARKPPVAAKPHARKRTPAHAEAVTA